MPTDKPIPRKKRRKINKVEPITQTGIPAGLAKSHKLIRTDKDLEVQFEKLCFKIQIEDFQIERSEQQRVDRRDKRR